MKIVLSSFKISSIHITRTSSLSQKLSIILTLQHRLSCPMSLHLASSSSHSRGPHQMSLNAHPNHFLLKLMLVDLPSYARTHSLLNCLSFLSSNHLKPALSVSLVCLTRLPSSISTAHLTPQNTLNHSLYFLKNLHHSLHLLPQSHITSLSLATSIFIATSHLYLQLHSFCPSCLTSISNSMSLFLPTQVAIPLIF